MKLRILVGMLALGVGLAPVVLASQAKQERTLTVQVSKILSERKGLLLVMLFRDDGFPQKHDRALRVKAFKVSGAVMSISFPVPGTGKYAFKVLHDEDENGRVTKKFGGIIPREGLGFSSGARLSWSGPPNFRQARFDAATVSDALDIELLYP